jgi:hypothetical protein
MTISILALAFLIDQAGGATVKGRVVDSVTGGSLQRVLVAVEETGLSTFTDAGGAFALLDVPVGRRKLFVSVVGYGLARRDVDVPASGLDLTIPLTEGTGAYTENVVVAADRFIAAEPAVPSQQLLGSADLQNLRGVLADDPLRAVQVMPGVAAADDLRSEFTVRGSGFANVNMTVDGFATPHILHTVRAVEDYSGSGSVAMINSDILQDVALLSGGYPQRYGNRTGAEIDFRLREGSRDRTHARLAVSGTNASAVSEGPLGRGKRGSWLVSARQSYLDLITKHIEDGTFQFGFTDAQAKAAYDLSRSQRITMTFLAGRSRALDRSNDAEDEERFVGRNASALIVTGWGLTKPLASVSVRALAAHNAFSNTASDGIRMDDGFNRQAALRVDTGVAVARHVYVEAGADSEWTAEHRMRRRSSAGRYRVINDFTGDAFRSGGYMQARLSAGALTVVPGVRADRWSLTTDRTISPWLQAQLALPASLTVRAATGRYQQFPAFEQVIGSLASASTRPQRAGQFDLAVEQRLGDGLRWQVTLYNREEDGYFRRPLADTRLVNNVLVRGDRGASFEQSLEGFARGVELLIHGKSAGALSGWISYAYGRNRYTDASRRESFDGDNDQRHTFNVYGFFRKSDRVSFSAKARIGSNVPAPGYYERSGDQLTLSSRRNELRLPAYSRIDVRANRTFNWSRSRMTLFAEIINLFNRDNVRFVPPRVNTGTRQVSRMFEQMVPILPSAGVLIEF